MDFEIEDGRLLACLGNDEDLVIPEGVKFIARDCTFSNAVNCSQGRARLRHT